MKYLLFVLLLVLVTGLVSGQAAIGKVFDAKTNESMVYVNIGIVDQPLR